MDAEHGMKILVVDDDRLNIKILTEMLDDSGYEVEACTSAREALDIVKQDSSFHVIMLDRMMPGMDGIGFMQEFIKMPQHKRMRVVMQTAAVTDRNIIEGTATGVYYYLTKPFSKDILLSVVKAACDDMKLQPTA